MCKDLPHAQHFESISQATADRAKPRKVLTRSKLTSSATYEILLPTSGLGPPNSVALSPENPSCLWANLPPLGSKLGNNLSVRPENATGDSILVNSKMLAQDFENASA